MNHLPKKLNFQNVNELTAQIRLFNLQFGIVKGTVYGDPKFTEFLYNEKNQDIIRIYQNNMELINGIIKKKIDGFISDQLSVPLIF